MKAAICLIIEDEFDFSVEYILDVLVWSTNYQISLHLFFNNVSSLELINLYERLVKEKQIDLGIRKAKIVDIQKSTTKKQYYEIYNSLLKNVQENEVVFFPQDIIVPVNWLEDTLYQKNQIKDCIGIGIKMVNSLTLPITLEAYSKGYENKTEVCFSTSRGRFNGPFIIDKKVLDAKGGFKNSPDKYQFDNYLFYADENPTLKIILTKKVNCFSIKT